MTDLTPNVYRLPQRRFDAIPGAPWVYWVSETIHALFETLPDLRSIAQPRQGLATADNFRFIRLWWEVGKGEIEFNCRSATYASASTSAWYPTAKGSRVSSWAGTEAEVVNWRYDGKEIRAFEGAVIRNPEFHFREGITLTRVGPSGFTARLNPGGYILDSSNSGCYPRSHNETSYLLGVLNSSSAIALLAAVNPTINFQVGDLINLPVPAFSDSSLGGHVRNTIGIVTLKEASDEASLAFVAPLSWNSGFVDLAVIGSRLNNLERQIDNEVFRLYGISDADRAAIEAELAGGTPDHEDGEGDEDTKPEEREDEAAAGAMTQEELAVRWISYAVGIVLGRFTIGDLRLTIGDDSPQSKIVNRQSSIGNAVYHLDDFAIGSLPAPDEAEFDELVGPVERFAYVDGDGGRHVFSAEVEQALRDLALTDGIAVLDEGHPRDLPALVERALALMLGERATTEVIQIGAANNLRKLLEKDFFTKWHLRWYRKRPVYWPLQSARRGYGFVLFHEKVEKYTLYVLLRDYLDHKLNGLRLQIEDLVALAAGQTGAARRQTERQLDRARQLLDEVNVFAQTIDRIAKGGYQPEANWIDDGVILRLAPLWELIPIWKAEPKKYWERLEQGDYDWSHIAMAYWPARVREACRVNKSFAIAHGLIND